MPWSERHAGRLGSGWVAAVSGDPPPAAPAVMAGGRLVVRSVLAPHLGPAFEARGSREALGGSCSADVHAGDEEDEHGAGDGEQQGDSGGVIGVRFGQDVGRADVEQEAGKESQIDEQLLIGEVEEQR